MLIALINTVFVGVTMLGCMTVVSMAQQNSESKNEGNIVVKNTTKIKTLIDPELLPPLEKLPAELSLITRENVVKARAIVSKMLKGPDTKGVIVTEKNLFKGWRYHSFYLSARGQKI